MNNVYSWANQEININFRSIWPQYSCMPKCWDLSSGCRRIDLWQSNCSTVNTLKGTDQFLLLWVTVFGFEQRGIRQLQPQRRLRICFTSCEHSHCLLKMGRLNDESLHRPLLWKTIDHAVWCKVMAGVKLWVLYHYITHSCYRVLFVYMCVWVGGVCHQCRLTNNNHISCTELQKSQYEINTCRHEQSCPNNIGMLGSFTGPTGDSSLTQGYFSKKWSAY